VQDQPIYGLLALAGTTSRLRNADALLGTNNKGSLYWVSAHREMGMVPLEGREQFIGSQNAEYTTKLGRPSSFSGECAIGCSIAIEGSTIVYAILWTRIST
jgi:hypothetical protein